MVGLAQDRRRAVKIYPGMPAAEKKRGAEGEFLAKDLSIWRQTPGLEADACSGSRIQVVMTAEDEHADETFHARENVIHEVGLFQGKLGLRRAIILMEEGCSTFSNIHGLTDISFPRGRIGAAFEDVRRVLERERIVGI